MAIFEEMIEDEEGLVDDRLPTTSRGLWAASEAERTLKAILSFAKAKRMDPELAEEGNMFMELFENWKKEYKVSRPLLYFGIEEENLLSALGKIVNYKRSKRFSYLSVTCISTPTRMLYSCTYAS